MDKKLRRWLETTEQLLRMCEEEVAPDIALNINNAAEEIRRALEKDAKGKN